MHNSSSIAKALEAQTPFLRRLARALLPDEHAAEDLVQDTLTAALGAFDSPNPGGASDRLSQSSPGGIRAWLSTILRRKSIDAFRSDRSRIGNTPEAQKASPDETADPHEQCALGIALRLEQQELLHKALLAIPEKYTTILVLRYQDELSFKAIAAAIEAPLATIKSRVVRGLELVRQELDRTSSRENEAGPHWLGSIQALAFGLDVEKPTINPVASASHLVSAAAVMLAVATMSVLLFHRIREDSPTLKAAPVDHISKVEPGLPAQGLPQSTPKTLNAPQAGESRRLLAGTKGDSTKDGHLTDPSQSLVLMGRVVSAMSRQALPARIQLGSSPAQAGNVTKGEFALQAPSSGTHTLHASYPRFEDLEIEINLDDRPTNETNVLDLGLLEMTPVTMVELIVLNERGAPVPNATGVLHRRLQKELDARGPGPGPSDLLAGQPIGTTDNRGRIRFPLAYAATAIVKEPSGRMAMGTVAPGSENILRIGGPARRIALRDSDTGAPVIARALPVGWRQGASQTGVFLWTDELGQADLPTGPGTLTLCKIEPRLLLDSMTIDDRQVETLKSEAFRVICSLNAEVRDITLRVINNEVALRLVDTSTQLPPADGIAYCQDQWSGIDHEWSRVPARTPYLIRSGVMLAHSWFSRPNPGGPKHQMRRWIAMAGYEPVFIEGAIDLEGATIPMTPCATRSLQFLDPLNRPLARSATIEFETGLRIIFDSDANGLAGPFSWTKGQDWRVYMGGAWKTVSSSELEAAAVVAVRFDSASGAIRIIGAPEETPPIFASRKPGALFPARSEAQDQAGNISPTESRSRQTALIDGIAPGDYAVGPKTWVAQLVNGSQSHGGLMGSAEPSKQHRETELIRVESGKTIEIEWNPDWSMTAPLNGRVLCDDLQGEELAVLPVYAPTGSRVLWGSQSPWRACSHEGRFRIEALAPIIHEG